MPNALQRLVLDPVTGIIGPPECWVLLDAQEGPFRWVLGHCAAAGLSGGWLGLLRLLEALLRLLGALLRLLGALLRLLGVLLRLLVLVLGGCFRRT